MCVLVFVNYTEQSVCDKSVKMMWIFRGAEVPASALMWTLYVQAQHYDALGELSRALESINRALEHTPTNVDLYMCKAKIYKVHMLAR